MEGGQTVIHVPTQEAQNAGTEKIPYAFVIPKLMKNPETGKYDLDNTEYDTFSPPTERVYIGFKYPTFTNWVANQSVNNTKWYQYHWGATNGTDNSGWGEPGQGGGETTGTKTVEYTSSDVENNPYGWSSSQWGIKVQQDDLVPNATSIHVELTFTQAQPQNYEFGTLSGSNFASGQHTGPYDSVASFSVDLSPETFGSGFVILIYDNCYNNFVNYLQKVVVTSSNE